MNRFRAKIKLGYIVFDLDGTLIDTMPQHAEIFSDILQKKHGIPLPYSRKEYYSTAGLPLDDQFQGVVRSYLGTHATDTPDLVDDFWKIAGRIIPKIINGVPETLSALRRAGYRLLISSGSTTKVVRSRTSVLGIAKHFDYMIGTEAGRSETKKGIGHFGMFCDFYSMDMEGFIRDTVIVGDGEHDMEVAKQLGTVSIGVATSTTKKNLLIAGADYVVLSTPMMINILRDRSEPQRTFLSVKELREKI